MALALRFAAVSDIGRTRKKNDDSGYAGPHFVMVADGMGGAAAGDLASAVAVQTMRRLDTEPSGDLLEALAGAVHRANDRLAELVEEDSAVDGMGTTVTAVLFEPLTSDDGVERGRIGVAHLGDSRGYLWRDGELLRISHDHSWVQSLIDEGRITEAEAKVHSHRSLLLKVLDGRHDNEPDLTVYDVQAGDRILICSDGLSGFVEHERIERVMAIGSADAVAGELLQIALEAMSTDNITVVVADVVDESEGPGPGAEPIVVGSAADNPRGAFSRLRSWAQRDEVDPNEHLVDPDIDPEELRYAPREPRRFRWVFRAIVLLVALGLIAGLGKLAYDWTQKQYYVSASGNHVAIFKGIQADVPLVTMHEVYETDPLLLSQLPDYRREQVVEGLAADDLEDARGIVSQLSSMADACAAQAAAASSASASRASAATKNTQQPPDKPADGERSRDATGKPRTSTPAPSTATDTGPKKPRSAEECSGAEPITTTGGPSDAPLSTVEAP